MTDNMRILRALVRAEAVPMHDHPLVPHGCTVTISRDSWSGAEEIAQKLSRELGVRCFDGQLIESLVAAARVAPDEMKILDERVGTWVEDWLYALSSGHHADRNLYFMHLVKLLHGIPDRGGVIVGRGAYLVLSNRNVFRVRITGSLDVCARRMALSQNVPVELARKRVKQANDERMEYIRSYFKRDANDPSTWDLCLNTDRINADDAVKIILLAMHSAGFPVQTEILHSAV